MTLCLFALSLQLGIQNSQIQDAWSGFGSGAWVVHTEKRVEGDQKRETRRKTEIISLGSRVMRKEMTETDGKFEDTGSLQMHVRGLLPSDLPVKSRRSEELSIDGQTFPCQVTQHTRETAGRKMSCTLWQCDKANVPYRELDTSGPDLALVPQVLKCEMEYDAPGQSGKFLLEVTTLKQTLKVGEKEVICVVEKGTISDKSEKGNLKATMERWITKEFPGHEAKLIIKGTLNDKPLSLEKLAVDFNK